MRLTHSMSSIRSMPAAASRISGRGNRRRYRSTEDLPACNRSPRDEPKGVPMNFFSKTSSDTELYPRNGHEVIEAQAAADAAKKDAVTAAAERLRILRQAQP